MPDSTIEIINGREGRRGWGVEEKLRIAAEAHEPGATVGAVAARHDVYPSLLRRWRRQVRDGHLAAAQALRRWCTEPIRDGKMLIPFWF